MSDLNRHIAIQLAPGWRPEPGATLTGEVAALGKQEGDYGAYPVLTLELPDGSFVSVHAFHEVLQDQLAELFRNHQLDNGETVTIHYAGRQESKNKNPDGSNRSYHQYLAMAGDGTDLDGLIYDENPFE